MLFFTLKTPADLLARLLALTVMKDDLSAVEIFCFDRARQSRSRLGRAPSLRDDILRYGLVRDDALNGMPGLRPLPPPGVAIPYISHLSAFGRFHPCAAALCAALDSVSLLSTRGHKSHGNNVVRHASERLKV